ncbi:MAG: RNA polymerase subunit sigma-70, partial [Lachnospiraceae bacterium]|nr:RNA polymerase subunit sigma-70 [Lachnospiraceae bacterium]
MEDSRIVGLYMERDESAIAESQRKYGRYCFAVAHNILRDREDAEECVNDTFLAAWNAIPPHSPEILSTFLGKITRRLS